MKNTLQKIIFVSTMFALSACSTSNGVEDLMPTAIPSPSMPAPILQHVTPTASSITKVEIQQLTDKIKKAEFTLMAFNDKNFIKDALKSKKETKSRPISEKDVTCVYNNLNRERYASEVPEVAQYLAKNYPQHIDKYNGKLDVLIPIVRKIYKYPKPVRFNSNDFSNSSALAILTPKEATELTAIIMNEDYAPLLATIGLPAKKADGSIEDISLMQISSLMEYIEEAWLKCQ
ncbi:MAG: hypothetical protein KGV51_01090 [Moraxellaceae bacterium]|nr:hypothetical protein [Moraxellaceae bacterium]